MIQAIAMERVVVDTQRFTLNYADERVRLTPSEFRLLRFLLLGRGQTFAREEIIHQVKGDDYPATPRSVDVCITALRRKIRPFNKQIETVRGQGYRFAADATVQWLLDGNEVPLD